jgi:hypothetical protein
LIITVFVLFSILLETDEQKIICNFKSEQNVDLNTAKQSVVADENGFFQLTEES